MSKKRIGDALLKRAQAAKFLGVSETEFIRFAHEENLPKPDTEILGLYAAWYQSTLSKWRRRRRLALLDAQLES